MFWLKVSMPDALFRVKPLLKTTEPEPLIDCAAIPLKVTGTDEFQFALLTRLPPIFIPEAEAVLKFTPEFKIVKVPVTFNVPELSVLVTEEAASKIKLPKDLAGIFWAASASKVTVEDALTVPPVGLAD